MLSIFLITLSDLIYCNYNKIIQQSYQDTNFTQNLIEISQFFDCTIPTCSKF